MRVGGTVPRWAIGVVIAAAFAGAALAVAGVQTPARIPLAVVFLFAVPALAIATLFDGLRGVPGGRPPGSALRGVSATGPDVLGTVVIAGTAALVIDMAIAESMIATGTWSLRLGVALVALVSVVIAASRP